MQQRPAQARARRQDYAPQVRARAMLDEGRRKLTPNYPDPGETKTKLTTLSAPLPAFRAVATASTGIATITIAKPTGTVQSDVMIAAIASESAGPVVTPPSGWTKIEDVGAAHNLSIFWKLAGASEPANYAFVSNISDDKVGGISSWAGVDPTTPIDVENGQATAAATTHATPTVTTTGDRRMLVAHHSADNPASTWTPPTGMTEAYDLAEAGDVSLEASYVAQNAAGATGAKTATHNGATTGATHILALNPKLSPLAIATPSTGRRVRLIRAKILQPTADGKHYVDIYFGTAATAAAADGAAAGGVVDVLAIPDQSSDNTRSWPRGEGPRGAKNTVLSAHFRIAPLTNHLALVEYTEER